MTIKTKLVFSYIGMILIPIVLVYIIANILFNVIPRDYFMEGSFSISAKPKNKQQSSPFKMPTFADYRQLLQTISTDPESVNNASFQGRIQSFCRKYNYLGILVRKNQRIIYSYHPSFQAKSNYPLSGFSDGSHQTVVKDLNGKMVSISRYDFFFKDGSQGSVFIIINMQPYLIQIKNIMIILALIVGVILVITNGLLTILVSRSIIKPLQSLESASNQIEQGNLNFTVAYKGKNEIGQLATAFEQMRSKLKDSLERQIQYENNRKELISGISHDLKTPVTAIKGYVEGIMDGVADTPEKVDKYIRTINRKANDLDRLIDELFLFSKLDLKKLPFNFEQVDLRAFLGDCLEEYRFDLNNQGIRFDLHYECDPALRVIGDRDKLKRVITNIIQNSIKYRDETKESSKINLSVEELADTVHLHIKDNGKGIRPTELPLIFDTFYRGDESRNSTTGGSGIGLAVAKLIIEAHSGQIWVESELGQGTTISFSLKKV